jgi:hypothetical protein
MRSQQRKTGKVTVTELELRKQGGTNNYSRSPTGGVRPYKYTTSDYTADTRGGESCYRIDVEHNRRTQAYVWTVYKDDNSAAIIPFDCAQEEDILRLWFLGNTLDITVNIAF